jgi:DNA repair exonuclease SbcCD ATPase subunit
MTDIMSREELDRAIIEYGNLRLQEQYGTFSNHAERKRLELLATFDRLKGFEKDYEAMKVLAHRIEAERNEAWAENERLDKERSKMEIESFNAKSDRDVLQSWLDRISEPMKRLHKEWKPIVDSPMSLPEKERQQYTMELIYREVWDYLDLQEEPQATIRGTCSKCGEVTPLNELMEDGLCPTCSPKHCSCHD